MADFTHTLSGTNASVTFGWNRSTFTTGQNGVPNVSSGSNNFRDVTFSLTDKPGAAFLSKASVIVELIDHTDNQDVVNFEANREDAKNTAVRLNISALTDRLSISVVDLIAGAPQHRILAGFARNGLGQSFNYPVNVKVTFTPKDTVSETVSSSGAQNQLSWGPGV